MHKTVFHQLLGTFALVGICGCMAQDKPPPETHYTIISETGGLRAIQLAKKSRDFQQYVRGHSSSPTRDLVYGLQSDYDAELATSYCPNEYHVDISFREQAQQALNAVGQAKSDKEADAALESSSLLLLIDVATGTIRHDTYYSSPAPAPESTPCLNGSAPISASPGP